jgi:hypothetical protein
VEKKPYVVAVKPRSACFVDFCLLGGVVELKKQRPASRWRCFKKKYVGFPGEGLKGVGGFKVLGVLGS